MSPIAGSSCSAVQRPGALGAAGMHHSSSAEGSARVKWQYSYMPSWNAASAGWCIHLGPKMKSTSLMRLPQWRQKVSAMVGLRPIKGEDGLTRKPCVTLVATAVHKRVLEVQRPDPLDLRRQRVPLGLDLG